ncbi:9192_t:CDS:2 [Ambispora leptoticha]|uniref:9192_t:CDS:1 n=1 Tax=Ambispora leptoticha TaxID=144679 RepID=A0A9N8Z187_9GLOM|nr:9192_t:CDS:2 [Ambispora leptoticha]
MQYEVAEEKYFEPVIINAALNSKKKSKAGFTPDRWRPRPIREMDLTIMVPPNQTLDDLLEEVRRDAAEKSTPTEDGAGTSADMFFNASGFTSGSSSISNTRENTRNTQEQEQPPPAQEQIADRSFGFSSMTSNQIVPIKKKSTKKPQPPTDINQIPEEESENYGITGTLGMFIKTLWGW